MLYETFNSIKESFRSDYFTSRVSAEVVQNLNLRFDLREYQREALGRFNFYLSVPQAARQAGSPDKFRYSVKCLFTKC